MPAAVVASATNSLETRISDILTLEKDLGAAEIFTKLNSECSGNNSDSAPFTKNQVKHCLKRLKEKQIKIEAAATTSHDANFPYQIRDLSDQDKGYGAIATREIEFGEEICRETPLLRISGEDISIATQNGKMAERFGKECDEVLERAKNSQVGGRAMRVLQEALVRKHRPILTAKLVEEKVCGLSEEAQEKFWKLHDGTTVFRELNEALSSMPASSSTVQVKSEGGDSSPGEKENSDDNSGTPSTAASAASLSWPSSSLTRWASGIFWSNAFPAPEESDEEVKKKIQLSSDTMVCFEKVSRFNHSCNPNAMLVWRHAASSPDVKRGSTKKNFKSAGSATTASLSKKSSTGSIGILVAIRPIEAEEEICICYCNWREPVESRQMILEASYGFNCNCTCCIGEHSVERDPGDRVFRRDMIAKGTKCEIATIERMLGEVRVQKLNEIQEALEVDRVLTPYLNAPFLRDDRRDALLYEDMPVDMKILRRVIHFHSKYSNGNKSNITSSRTSPKVFYLELIDALLEAYHQYSLCYWQINSTHLKYTDPMFGLSLGTAVWCALNCNATQSRLATSKNLEKLCREAYDFFYLVHGSEHKQTKLAKFWCDEMVWNRLKT